MNKFIVVPLDRYQRKDDHTKPKNPTLVRAKTVDSGHTPFLVDQRGLGGNTSKPEPRDEQGLGGNIPQSRPRQEDTTPLPPPPPPVRRKVKKKVTKWL